MANLHNPSSPIKQSAPPADGRSAIQITQDIRRSGIVQEITSESFCKAYLSRSSHQSWTKQEESYVSQIRNPEFEAKETSLYIPLLCLLNSMSKKVAAGRHEALVFRGEHRVKNPFTSRDRKPDIIVQWEQYDAFDGIDYSEESPSKIWTQLAAVGEVKVAAPAESQLTSYLQNHLRFHPELNAVLGFSIRSTGYMLFYHDAAVVHGSKFEWEPGPLYEFIEKLYTRPFQDWSMQVQSAQTPRWAIKIGDDVYLSKVPNIPGGPDVQGGPGQRRLTAEVENDAKNGIPILIFIKDTWRYVSRFYFEGLLLERAHKGESMCGLMRPISHGYVLDQTGKPIRTTCFNPKSGEEDAPGRFKMRMVTDEIGQPLEGVHSLYKFLCAMYDACAVQRNLYRKCKILHRDISDKNIMFAPGMGAYQKRNRGGYAEVKFVNQVLAKDEHVDPAPECLVIDLGNGADLEVVRGTDTLTERTGTPKFIARSVSYGKLLCKRTFSSKEIVMPLVEGVLADYHHFMHATEYRVDTPGSATRPEAKFAHQLFHDAESTFWVIAWTLARSIKAGSEQESEPHVKFRQFFSIMYRHYPIPGGNDSRQVLSYDDWPSILHPDLAMLGPMLANMFDYVRPEWAHRPELNNEHVHEALMRLLLIEIINIKNSSDINIDIGGRQSPPPPLGEDHLPQSITGSRTKSMSRSQTNLSMDRTNSIGGSSKRQRDSLSATAETSGPKKRRNISDGPAARTRIQQCNASTQLQEQERKLVWLPGPCKLRKPGNHGEGNPPSSPPPESPKYV
ncbi:unnamed protein product [Rhizoctonia solani]|uniref:Fungal-type protein kinase domain-containing protein n=1 Tax=Rhizoctonia solani TaxID=456999 RepID=A0A8H3D8T1_9AGAM|nr:unnamed protein product [Rhizoctonia solani]